MRFFSNSLKVNFVLCFIALHSYLSNGQSVDVNLMTGSPEINIPLFSLSDRDFSASFYLQYSSNGIKPAENSGMFGNSWSSNLDPGIYRIPRGLPDEINTSSYVGWIANNSAVSSFLENDTEDINYNKLNNFISGNTIYDTEPDLFFVNAPHLNLSFVYNAQDNIVTTEKFEGQIIPVIAGNQIVSFQVKIAGVTYNFNTVESTIKQSETIENFSPYKFHPYYVDFATFSKGLVNINTAWKLTSIQSIGGANIQFYYALEELEASSESIKFSSKISSEPISVAKLKYGSSWYEIPFYQQNVAVSRQNLKQITTSDGTKVMIIKGLEPLIKTFAINTTEEISPINQNTSLINGIKIFNNKGIYQQGLFFDMDQYFYGTSNNSLRVLLRNIWLDENRTMPGYSFNYFDMDNYKLLPGNTDYFDQFGYASNTLFHNSSGQFNNTHDNELLQSGMLQKMTLPSGGYYEFTYEPNVYRNSLLNLDSYGGGVRVKNLIRKLDNNGANIVQYEYNDDSNNSSGVLLYKPTYYLRPDFVFDFVDNQVVGTSQLAFNNSYDQNLIFQWDINGNNSSNISVGYTQVKTKFSNGSYLIDNYEFPRNYLTTQVDYHGISWEAPDVKPARLNTATYNYDSPNLSIGYKKYPFPPEHVIPGMNGRMIKHREFDTNGLKKQIDYSYTLSTGSIVKGLSFEKLPTRYNSGVSGSNFDAYMYVFSLYNIYVNYQLNTNSVVSTYTEGSLSLTENFNSIPHSIYSNRIYETRTINSKGEILINRVKYLDDLNLNSSNQGDAFTLYELKANGFGHLPIENLSIIQKGGQEYLLAASTNTYVLDAGTKWFYPKKSFVITLDNPIQLSSFTPLNVVSNDLGRDSRYKEVSENITADVAKRKLYSVRMDDGFTFTNIFQDYRLSGSVDHASAANFGFMSFEENNQIFNEPYHAIVLSSGYNAGRKDGKSVKLTTTSHEVTRQNITKSYSKYIVGFWAKKTLSGSGNVIVTVDGSSYSFPVLTTNWEYYQREFNVTSSVFNCKLSIGGNYEISVDELMVVPSDAAYNYQLFDDKGRVIGDIGLNGRGIYYEYDVLDRISITRDADGNILTKNEYGSLVVPIDEFDIFPHLEAGVLKLNAVPSLPGASYFWSTFSGIGTNILKPHVQGYPGTAGNSVLSAPTVNSTIYLKVVYNGSNYYKAIYFEPSKYLN